MKTNSKTSISRLLNSFDNELKNLLMDDLRGIKKAKKKLMESLAQTVNNNTLSAA